MNRGRSEAKLEVEEVRRAKFKERYGGEDNGN